MAIPCSCSLDGARISIASSWANKQPQEYVPPPVREFTPTNTPAANATEANELLQEKIRELADIGVSQSLVMAWRNAVLLTLEGGVDLDSFVHACVLAPPRALCSQKRKEREERT